MRKDYNLINRAIKIQNDANGHDLLALVSAYQIWLTNFNQKYKDSESRLREFVCQEENNQRNLLSVY